MLYFALFISLDISVWLSLGTVSSMMPTVLHFRSILSCRRSVVVIELAFMSNLTSQVICSVQVTSVLVGVVLFSPSFTNLIDFVLDPVSYFLQNSVVSPSVSPLG